MPVESKCSQVAVTEDTAAWMWLDFIWYISDGFRAIVLCCSVRTINMCGVTNRSLRCFGREMISMPRRSFPLIGRPHFAERRPVESSPGVGFEQQRSEGNSTGYLSTCQFSRQGYS